MKTVLACLMLAAAATGALACLLIGGPGRPAGLRRGPVSPGEWGLVGSLRTLGACVFFNVTGKVLKAGPALAADRVAYRALPHVRNLPLDDIMTTITEPGDSVVGAVAISVGTWPAYVDAWRTLRDWIAAIVGRANIAFNGAKDFKLYRTGAGGAKGKGRRPVKSLMLSWPLWAVPSAVFSPIFLGKNCPHRTGSVSCCSPPVFSSWPGASGAFSRSR